MKNITKFMAILLLAGALPMINVYSQSTSKTTKELSQGQKMLNLITERIGISMDQARVYLAKKKELETKLREVAKMKIGDGAKQQRKDVIINNYNNDLRSFLTPQQFTAHENLTKYNEERISRKNSDVESFKVEYYGILELPKSQRYEAREALINRYIASIKTYLNDDKLASMSILNVDRNHKAKYYLDGYRGLSETERIKLGDILRKSAAKKHELSQLKKSNPGMRSDDYNKRMNSITDFENKNIEKIIGSERLQSLMTYKANSSERFYKNHLGFTNEEYDYYADICNKVAIEELSIRRSGLTKSEQSQKIQTARAQIGAYLMEVLSPTAYDKWNKHDLKRKAAFQKNKLNN